MKRSVIIGGVVLAIVGLGLLGIATGAKPPVAKQTEQAPAKNGTDDWALSERLDHLYEILNGAYPRDHGPDRRKDGRFALAVWLNANSAELKKDKMGIVLNAIHAMPQILVTRYFDETYLDQNNHESAAAKLESLDAIKIIGLVVESDSVGKISGSEISRKISKVIIDSWISNAPQWPSAGYVEAEGYRVSVGYIRRTGPGAEKDGSVGLFSLALTLEVPVSGNSEK